MAVDAAVGTAPGASSSLFLGRWKSGRKWKEAGIKSSRRISSKGVASKRSWATKLAARQQAVLESAAKKERMAKLEQAKTQQREARQKKLALRTANERRGETVQIIKNAAKIKKMSNKQRRKLRQVAKA